MKGSSLRKLKYPLEGQTIVTTWFVGRLNKIQGGPLTRLAHVEFIAMYKHSLQTNNARWLEFVMHDISPTT